MNEQQRFDSLKADLLSFISMADGYRASHDRKNEEDYLTAATSLYKSTCPEILFSEPQEDNSIRFLSEYVPQFQTLIGEVHRMNPDYLGLFNLNINSFAKAFDSLKRYWEERK